MDRLRTWNPTLDGHLHGQAPANCPLVREPRTVPIGADRLAAGRLPTVSRVLLVELDGASYDLLVPLAEAGLMPHLAEWMRRASLVDLRPVTPCAEAVLWTTLETGAGPEVHGVLDNSYLDHRCGRLFARLVRPASCAGLSDVVSAADPKAPAICLADAASAGAIWRRRPNSLAELTQGVAWIESQFEQVVERAARADATGDWRLLTLRIDLLDGLANRVWNLLGVDPAGGGPRPWVEQAQQAFVTLDRALGNLFRLAERRQAAVMLVSPYGQAPLEEKISLPEILRRRDLLQTGTSTWQALHRLGRTIDKFCRWPWTGMRRARGGFPQATPVPTVLRFRKVAPFDWRRSRALCFHGEMAAMVYLNTRERFGERLLSTRRQRDQAATEALWALQEAVHPITGQRLFDEAFLTEERYGDDPLARLWPDIVAIPAIGFQSRPAPDRGGRLLRTDPVNMTTHRPGGMWMAAFPGAEPARQYTADLVDVAPTVLRLLGLRRPRSMTGRPVEELLAPRVSRTA
jgi:predicted AlkP superfamily phosphohydrolase/phosphomutase